MNQQLKDKLKGHLSFYYRHLKSAENLTRLAKSNVISAQNSKSSNCRESHLSIYCRVESTIELPLCLWLKEMIPNTHGWNTTNKTWTDQRGRARENGGQQEGLYFYLPCCVVLHFCTLTMASVFTVCNLFLAAVTFKNRTPAAFYHRVGSELHILADLHILGVDPRA